MTRLPAPSNDGAGSALSHWTDKADAWTGQADQVARTADAFNQILLDAAALAPGHRVLDLASGAGEPALSEAALVGPNGLVVATDLVEPMVRGIQRRDTENRLQLSVCDMQSLPFAAGSFDRLVCRFGIMFPPDPASALEDAKRVLKPGGRAAYLVWGPYEDQTMFPILFDAVEEVTGEPPTDQHRAIFRFGAPDSLAAPARTAGFRDVAVQSHWMPSLAPLGKPFWRATLSMTFGGLIAKLTDADRAAIDTAVWRRLARYEQTDTTAKPGYHLTAHVLVVTGTA